MDYSVQEMANEALNNARESFDIVKDNNKRVTTITDIRSYSQGAIVELPSFGPGQPFIVRMRRPSLMILIKTGKIPNQLLTQATSLFTKGSSAVNGRDVDMTELINIFDIIAESALIEPSYNDIISAGIELTDDQLSAIFAYVQSGVKALEQFRTE